MVDQRRGAVRPLRLVDDRERRARLARRQGLASTAAFESVAAATTGMTVLHATEPASVHLALWARVLGVTVDDVERALYVERSIVKQGAMRRTLFAFPRDLLPAAWGSAAARVAREFAARLAKDLLATGVTDDGERWIADASEEVLAALSGGAELSARALRDVVPTIDCNVDRSPGTKWGGSFPVAPQLLTILNGQGRILRATNAAHWRLSKPRWATTADWLGEVPAATTERDGYAELLRRWLTTFGPGTEQDMRWWLGGTLGAVRAALADLGAVPVQLPAGDVGWLLPDDTETVDDPGPWAALLPTLDPTVMGWKDRGFYLGPHAPALIDSAGNAGTTAWWRGRVVGCWVQDDAARVRVHLLDDVPAEGRRALANEAERLTSWLAGTPVVTIYVSPAMRAAGGPPAGPDR